MAVGVNGSVKLFSIPIIVSSHESSKQECLMLRSFKLPVLISYMRYRALVLVEL
jgi:hypothetical protein